MTTTTIPSNITAPKWQPPISITTNITPNNSTTTWVKNQTSDPIYSNNTTPKWQPLISNSTTNITSNNNSSSQKPQLTPTTSDIPDIQNKTILLPPTNTSWNVSAVFRALNKNMPGNWTFVQSRKRRNKRGVSMLVLLDV
jgi:hypothetical protein